MFGIKKKEDTLEELSYSQRMLSSFANSLAIAYNLNKSFGWWEVEQFIEDLAAIDHYMKELNIKEYKSNGLVFTQCLVYNCVIVKSLK